MELILKYFPDLTETQIKQFSALKELYSYWNERINVISRKDIENLYERHILHSLAIAKTIKFVDNTSIIDVGTGGGFPGIPLAIIFPKVDFHLVDSIGKKITVVNEISAAIKLKNVVGTHARSEEIKQKYDFIISRAVTEIPKFIGFTKHLISKNDKNALPNGILYLKGGDFTDELKNTKLYYELFEIIDYYSETFFHEKKVVYMTL
ncbi:MAG: 16S rRNA (guanine(527)-N(7))-methyltransferase RsmG [Salinivirgaceae bacterium]|nr:16S rRNA (guanine(527)-N(7))-methyltransferase RsmG [Salinivirgaceae bacterium]MDD4746088.1 16S rRNA (guanine(527)-N(7))-methyltransferase RsmG [Salinivirgaceae bacterium]